MKKTILFFAIIVVSQLSAMDTLERNYFPSLDKQAVAPQAIDCIEYNITPSCSSTPMTSTVCYEVGNRSSVLAAQATMIATMADAEATHCGD